MATPLLHYNIACVPDAYTVILSHFQQTAVPSIVTFCASSCMANISDDKSVSTVEICICLPLHGLHGPDSDDLIIELSLQDNSTFPGAVLVIVSLYKNYCLMPVYFSCDRNRCI